MNSKKHNFLGNDWVEMTQEEFYESEIKDHIIQCIDGKFKHFKKAEQYPKVFEMSGGWKLKVWSDANITMVHKSGSDHLIANGPEDIEALRQAIAESDKIREKKE